MEGLPSKQQLFDYFIAIVVGNLFYLFLLEPFLPVAFQHRPFHLDLGLLMDFLFCVGVYFAWRAIRKNARGSSTASPPKPRE